MFARDERSVITTSERAGQKSLSSTDGDGVDEESEDTASHSLKPSDKPQQPQSTALALKTVIGTTISVFVYIVQFIGLRGMHWSASIAQLSAMLVMVCLRAWI